MGKKGLVLIHALNNLYQFSWYYCNQGKGKEWDALCLPSQQGEYTHPYCEASGMFSNIYHYETSFFSLGTAQKLKTFLSMTGHSIIGQQKRFCRNLLNQHVNLDDYDELVIHANVSVLTGACVVLSEEKNVVILDDGLGEYPKRSKWITMEQFRSAYNREGFILSRMGYCSPGWYYFDAEKNCTKYSCYPEKMEYRNYKEIRQLFNEEGTDLELFDKIMRRIYPALDQLNLENVDAVFFTRPLCDYVKNDEPYVKLFEQFVNEHCHNIVIKKHPREAKGYHFANHIVCGEIDKTIPAEVILPYIKDKNIYIMCGSTVLMYTKPLGIHFNIIDFKGLYEESVSEGYLFKPMSEKEIRDNCDNFSSGNYEIFTL